MSGISAWIRRKLHAFSGGGGEGAAGDATGGDEPDAGDLGGKTGPILTAVIDAFCDRIKVDERGCDRIRDLARRGTVVYTFKNPSAVGALWLRHRYAALGLPEPAIASGVNLLLYQPLSRVARILAARLRRLVKERRWSASSLGGAPFLRSALRGESQILFFPQDPSTLRRIHGTCYNPLVELARAQRETAKPIFLVPHLLVVSPSPARSRGAGVSGRLLGEPDDPGPVRRAIRFLRGYRGAFVQVGEPLDLQAFLAKHADLDAYEAAFLARREVLDRIERERKVVFGPRREERYQIMEKILKDDEVEAAVQRLAGRPGQSLRKANRAAYEMLDEIAADLDGGTLAVWDRILDWIWRNLFDGMRVDEAGIERVRDLARRTPIVFVPSHKSHLDYLVLSYVLYRHHMVPPLVAAGVNLAFWPMGRVFRKSGAFFIRRSFRKTDALYRRILSKYIEVILREGYTQEFFIEGGRSRTGKLVQPKAGYLSMLAEARAKGACKDVAFLPVAITYERVMEERSYMDEACGKPKRRESLFELVGSWRHLFRRYGRVYVTFGEPIRLELFLEEARAGLAAEGRRASPQKRLKGLAYRIAHEINRVSVVSPVHLVSAALLADGRSAIPEGRIRARVAAYQDYLKTAGAPIGETIEPRGRAFEDVMRVLQARSYVSRLRGQGANGGAGREPIYLVRDEARLSLDYYKNMALHHLLPVTFLAVAASAKRKRTGELDREHALDLFTFLRGIFRREFIYDGSGDGAGTLDQALGYCLAREILVPANGGKGGNGTAASWRVAPGAEGVLRSFAALLDPYLEAYLLVYRAAGRLAGNGGVAERDFVARVGRDGLRGIESGEIVHREALSEITLRNAVEKLRDEKLLVQRQSEGDEEAPRAAGPVLRLTDPGGRHVETARLIEALLGHRT